MIIGIGTDVVFIPRIQKVITKYGIHRFLHRIFTDAEIEQVMLRPSSNIQCHIAGRFACKEAMFKALSSKKRLGWRDFSIIKHGYGGIGIKANNEETRRIFDGINTFLSISHDGDYAVAFALAMLGNATRKTN